MGTISGVFTLVGGGAAAQAITFVATLILTRFYSPSQFGEFALLFGAASILSIIATGRFEIGILGQREFKKADELRALALRTSLASTGLTAGMIAVFGPPSQRVSLLVMTGWALLLSIVSIAEKFANYQENFRLIALQRIVGALSAAVVALAIVGFSRGINGLILGALIAAAISVAILLVPTGQRHALGMPNNDWLRIAIDNRKFPLFTLPHALFNALGAQLPVFIIQLFFGASVLGAFALAMRIALAPVSLLATAIFSAISPKMARWLPQDFKRNFRSLVHRLLISAVVASSLLMLAPYVFSRIFSPEWAEAGRFIQILSPHVGVVIVISPLAYLPILAGKQGEALQLEIISVGAKMAALSIGGKFGDAQITLLFFSLTGLIVGLFTLFWYFKLAKILETR